MSKITLLPVEAASISFDGAAPRFADDTTRECLTKAARLLRDGQTVAFPTETVYGLGANATDSSAVQQIFKLKGRPLDNPLIAHIDSHDMLQRYITDSLFPAYEALTRKFWPGPLTLLFRLPQNSPFAPEVTAAQPTVAIRMPVHPVARALIHLAGFPLAAPSANTSGRPSPTHFEHVQADMAARLGSDPSLPDLTILQGSVSDVGLESTVVDGVSCPDELRVLRPGGVGPDDIERCLQEAGLSLQVKVYGRDWRDAKAEASPATPGMKYRHYSPTCKTACLELHRPISREDLNRFLQDECEVDPATSTIGCVRLQPSQLPPVDMHYDFGATSTQQASNLFAALRDLEGKGCSIILIECPPIDQWSAGIGVAIQERLAKATGQMRDDWKTFR